MFLYIDATAGGMLLQVLLGGFTGVAVVGRLLWGRLPGRGSKDHDEDSQFEAPEPVSAEPPASEVDRAA